MELSLVDTDIDTDTARPEVLSLHIQEKGALYAAYMPFLRHGGLFVPTQRELRLGQEVFLLLTLLDSLDKLVLPARVVWLTPARAGDNRVQGVGVEFVPGEPARQARHRIEGLLGGVLNSSRPTHTL